MTSMGILLWLPTTVRVIPYSCFYVSVVEACFGTLVPWSVLPTSRNSSDLRSTRRLNYWQVCILRLNHLHHLWLTGNEFTWWIQRGAMIESLHDNSRQVAEWTHLLNPCAIQHGRTQLRVWGADGFQRCDSGFCQEDARSIESIVSTLAIKRRGMISHTTA